MAAPLRQNQWITILMMLVCLFFLGIGLYTIIESHNIYQASLSPLNEKVKPRYEAFKEGYSLAQTFFILAAGVLLTMLLLPRLQSISFGGVSINMQAMEQKIKDIATQQNLLQEGSADAGGGKAKSEEDRTRIKSTIRQKKQEVLQSAHPDDPQKGKWGEKDRVGNRMLSAEVTPALIPDLFNVILRVKSTDRSDPLTGLVYFHLHDTFRNQDPVMAVQEGEAVLKLNMVYGAFTVGAETDNKTNRLELDLSALPEAPHAFRIR